MVELPAPRLDGDVSLGAFGDAAVTRALSLPSDNAPLYLIPVGHPA
jgi:hypothetical protein